MVNPLNNLLHQGQEFVWTKECQAAFDAVKKKVISPRVLKLFDPKKFTVVAADASAVDIGAALSHHFSDGERLIFFVSRSLNKTLFGKTILIPILLFRINHYTL